MSSRVAADSRPLPVFRALGHGPCVRLGRVWAGLLRVKDAQVLGRTGGAEVALKEHADSHPKMNRIPQQPGTHLALQDCPEQESLAVLYIRITCRDFLKF